MAQASIEGWGGAREGGGRRASIAYGSGETTAVTTRMGQKLLQGVQQLWPGLNDGDCVRNALWQAVGIKAVVNQGLTQPEAAFSTEEQECAEMLLALLREWGVESDPTGATPLGVRIENAYKVVNNDAVMIERLRIEGHLTAMNMLKKAAYNRRIAGSKLLD